MGSPDQKKISVKRLLSFSTIWFIQLLTCRWKSQADVLRSQATSLRKRQRTWLTLLKSGKNGCFRTYRTGRRCRPVFGSGSYQFRCYLICFGFDPVDVLHVCLLRSSSGLDRRRCFGIEHLFHNGYPCILPGSPYVAGYCRYGVDAGYGCRCQRVDLRTYERGTSCR